MEKESTEPLPISKEYDTLRKNHFSSVECDRSMWRQQFFSTHPEVHEYVQRINPIDSAILFTHKYLPHDRYVSQKTLLELISQHLLTLGLTKSYQEFNNEAENLQFDKFKNIDHRMSQLSLLIQRGVFNMEKMLELAETMKNAQKNKTKLNDEFEEEFFKYFGFTPNFKKIENNDIDELIIDEEANILLRGSLKSIINFFTTDNKNNKLKIDKHVKSAFCLTYKSFTTTNIFFDELKERFLQLKKNKQKKEAILTFKLIKLWLRKAKSEIEHYMMNRIKGFLKKEVENYLKVETDILFAENITKEIKIDYSNAPDVNLGNCCLFTNEFDLFDLPPEELARQLTYWSSQKYYSIQDVELLNGAWANQKLKYKAPNLTALIEHDNKVSQWVAYHILKGKTLGKRLSTWSYFISVMKCLWDMQNYLDAFSINGGFCQNEIFRLNLHKSLLQKKDLEIMKMVQSCIDEGFPTFRLIRELHEEALKKDTPVLPYYAILLGDIFQYNEVEKNIVDGLVNVKKCTSTYKYIKSFKIFKKNKYNFLPIEQIQNRLSELKTLDDELLSSISLEIEPIGATEIA